MLSYYVLYRNGHATGNGFVCPRALTQFLAANPGTTYKRIDPPVTA